MSPHPQNNPLLNPPVLSQSPYNISNPSNRPPSPATAAAAMSLGALAAAASMAAPVAPPPPPPPPPPPVLQPPPLPPQYHHSPYQSQNTSHYLPQTHHPQPIQPHSHDSSLPQPQPYSSLHHNHQIVPAPAMSQLARPKTNPTPVAPAPTNMHPSQQQPTHPNGKPKQKRYRASPEQLRHLLAQFEANPSPSSTELQELAMKIRMPAQSAVLWFKNRRARVPHKKTEKALAAKRREATELPVVGGVGKRSPSNNDNTCQSVDPKPEPTTTDSSSPTAQLTAATTIADMDAADAKEERQAGRNITNQDKRLDSIPSRSPSRSPLPLYRNRAVDAVPFDIGLVTRLSTNKNGAEFSTPTTVRRPRVVPPTPRLLSQKEYKPGDKVEVLETSKGICRSWYSATIVGRGGLKELSLGDSAASVVGNLPKLSALSGKESPIGENAIKGDDQDGDGGDSPRTVRSPAASPTPPIAKIAYLVEYDHRFEDEDSKHKLQEEILASRIRPAPPFNDSSEDWRPDPGEAVEVLRDGAWFVAVTQAFAVRKGYMVSFESGDVQWVRRPGLRPYQIWRGGDSWVTKTKPPLPVVRKSVGLSVTHPPGGKRKRRCMEASNGSSNGITRETIETRASSKRAKSMVVDESGPDGLPEGWRRMENGRNQTVYMAPDGNRLRCLKEAQRYVKLMGPG